MCRRLSALVFWFKVRDQSDVTESIFGPAGYEGFQKGSGTRNSMTQQEQVSFQVLSLVDSLGAVC